MRKPNGIEVYDLQFKIDEKLHEIQKQKKQVIKVGSKSSALNKGLQQMKWHAGQKHIFCLPKPKQKCSTIVTPPMENVDLMDVVNRIMLLQKSLIELGNDIANYRRLQMLCIFYQCFLSIIFNSYNLVLFLLKMANRSSDVPLSLAMLLFFYGYPITSSFSNIIFSVMAYSSLFKSIRQTASQMDELNMYILDGAINSRISQLSTYVFNNLRTFSLFGLFNVDGSLVTSIISGTTTYIIILIQYSGDGEICKSNQMNKTQVS